LQRQGNTGGLGPQLFGVFSLGQINPYANIDKPAIAFGEYARGFLAAYDDIIRPFNLDNASEGRGKIFNSQGQGEAGFEGKGGRDGGEIAVTQQYRKKEVFAPIRVPGTASGPAPAGFLKIGAHHSTMVFTPLRQETGFNHGTGCSFQVIHRSRKGINDR
jgi:hypothetical protein